MPDAPSDRGLHIPGNKIAAEPPTPAHKHNISTSLPERWIPLHAETADTSRPVFKQPVLKQQPIGSSIESLGQLSPRRRQRAFIKIQDGCRYRCTYCVVTLARGDEKSRSVYELVDEVNTLFEQGVHEIVLTGVHVGGYGSDTGENLATLVQALLSETDIPRIRFASVEPWDLEDELLAQLADPRVMPHMHLPLQSGSDSVLKRMARRCKTDDFKALVSSLKAAIPGFNVTTDIIAGFPGETDTEWKETIDFVESINFGHIHVFPFSARAGTKASRLPDELNGTIKRERARELRELAGRMRYQFLEECIDTQVEVLWEKIDQTPSSVRLQGYTPNFVKVATSLEANEMHLGEQWVNRITALELKTIVTGSKGKANEPPDYQLTGIPVREFGERSLETLN